MSKIAAGIRLILLRHSKAEPAHPEGNDRDRALSHHGRALALERAKQLVDLGWLPDLVLVSNATRTLETWEAMTNVLGQFIPMIALPGLYLGGLAELQAEITSHHQSARTILAVGHNPGWSDAAMELAHEPIALPVCGAALLTCSHQDWAKAIWNTDGWQLKMTL